jgi:hypothetical protein
MAISEDVVAYKLTATSDSGTVVAVQYVSPDSRRYAAKLLVEEGYEVTEEALNEMPEGVSLDVE